MFFKIISSYFVVNLSRGNQCSAVWVTGSGEIEFPEFLQLSAKFLIEEDEEAMLKELKEAFRLYDKEGRPHIYSALGHRDLTASVGWPVGLHRDRPVDRFRNSWFPGHLSVGSDHFLTWNHNQNKRPPDQLPPDTAG